MILLLDQFTRNIYRNTAEMFAGDSRALELAHYMVNKKWDLELIPSHRIWIYLPFEHSENIKDQCISVQKSTALANLDNVSDQEKEFFQKCLDFALDHKQTIERFGRFPFRNSILKRESTAEELEYINAGKGNYINANSSNDQK